jgi:rhamnose utilization protein RhaD (predicted bifunctional aldolase and dehydrogenase)/NAD(P)-dependent dehydrogenase (short-subunit alcohol dehydrogenase family)
MESLWNDEAASRDSGDLLELRAYTSRLLGSNPDLVLHGGGNTSLKVDGEDLFGEPQHLLYVKGSGWDLASMRPQGFAPLLIDPVRRLTELPELSDTDMMRSLRSASRDPDAPAPSVETITHAIVPHRFVDHTHADAIVTVSNTNDGVERIRRIYGESVLIIPYAMPGFILAKLVDGLTKNADWDNLAGLVLMNHGVFTFDDDAKASYERMIDLVGMAEAFIAAEKVHPARSTSPVTIDLATLARLRKAVSAAAGIPMIASVDVSPEAVGFSERADAIDLAQRGCLTPDHVLHAKPWPMVVGGDSAEDVASYADGYKRYFVAHASADHAQLDPAPRWGIWPGKGIVTFGPNAVRASVVRDIVSHGMRAAQYAEQIGGWAPVSGQDLFDVEYWDLEQAKLRRGGSPPPLQGKVAVVTGAASGIGRASAEALMAQGVAVVALDLNADVAELSTGPAYLGIACDVTDTLAVDTAIASAVERFGGIDVLVANAGSFPPTTRIEDMDDATWAASLDVNMTGHLRVLRAATPFLREGIYPAVVVVASKNVPAPGPGAAAYSAAKAGLTQLARVAALELGQDGIRVNVLHPNAVFDTGVWTDEVLASRAAAYGLSVDDYKRNNVLGVDVTSKDVAAMVCAMASPLFAKTTGAQVPVDGGNERVI